MDCPHKDICDGLGCHKVMRGTPEYFYIAWVPCSFPSCSNTTDHTDNPGKRYDGAYADDDKED